MGWPTALNSTVKDKQGTGNEPYVVNKHKIQCVVPGVWGSGGYAKRKVGNVEKKR